MNLLIWNVSGLNHPSKQKEAKSMIQRHKISLICLIETRVKENKANKVRSCIVLDWDYVFNYDQHFLGRIWICWKKPDFEVTILDKSEQSINCVIKSLKSYFCWFHSFVYGANKGVDRKLLWVNLSSMKGKVAILDKSEQSINCVIKSLKSYFCWFHYCLWG
jgi:exonuclease III